jgi:hypothetical protein
MNTTKTKQARKPRIQKPIKLIVEHEFIGNQTIYEALTPIIIEDLQRKVKENRTFDCTGDKA